MEGTVVTAHYQKSGRGYSGNLWQSEPGKNLLASIILYPVFLSLKHQFFLNLVVSLAVADTVEALLKDDDIHIKWPNDVFAGNKKIAGILIQNAVQGVKLRHSVVGIGLNVNQETFDPSLPCATSMYLEKGMEFALLDVKQKLFFNLEKRYTQLKNQQMALIQKQYMKRLYRLDETTLFSGATGTFNGKIMGLTQEGKLIIEKAGRHEVFGLKEVQMIQHDQVILNIR